MRLPDLTGGPVPRRMSETTSPPGRRRSRVREVGLNDCSSSLEEADFFFFFLDFFLEEEEASLLLLLSSVASSSPVLLLVSFRAAESVSSSSFAFFLANFLRWLLLNFVSALLFESADGVSGSVFAAFVGLPEGTSSSSSSNFLFLVAFEASPFCFDVLSAFPFLLFVADALSAMLSFSGSISSFSSSSDMNASAYRNGESSLKT
mmetsp:Transcript_32/g.63  ORF Transcript_32/g.63 Transcript_32/m.63 type:complete len:205 (-) Transcript_32:241-855(-)